MVVLSLDGNQDHVVSAKEFRNWLFPQKISAGNMDTGNLRDNTEAMNVLLDALKTFNDDIVTFFEALDRLVLGMSLIRQATHELYFYLSRSRNGIVTSKEISSGLEVDIVSCLAD